MKVLFIASGDDKYGASKSLWTLMLTLRKKYGVRPILLTKRKNALNVLCDGEDIENYSFWYRDIMAGAPYRSVFLRCAKHAVKYLLYLIGAVTYTGIQKLNLEWKTIDLVHTNLNRIDIGVYISMKYKIPHVWHIREFGEEDYNVIMYKRHCIAYMNTHAERFIAISSAVRDAWVKKGIKSEKIIRVYNGVDTSAFLLRQPRGDNLIKMIISGHVQPNKGQLQLVEAIGLLPPDIKRNIRADIVGGAYREYANQIKKRVKALDLEKQVRLCGYCDDIPQKLSEYDIGVTCSKAEGFGRVTAEYMLAGLTVIASDTGANAELITDATDGLLYRWGNPQDLADKIRALYENRQWAETIALAGKKKALELFSETAYADGVFQAYSETLRKVECI
ncbi:glycosyl transferase family 1 [Synergistales bacterium]|nr:glycosyl transferase family 1 [Synergistales bacterium]